ncbi:MAG: PIN domain protein [Thermodesulfobacteriota bacterium]|nr:PIN domain protein [Thermodesulfobacteriota bacterium]
MKPRIYIDTSVIGGCFDEEFAYWSKSLMEEFHSGASIAVVSDITRSELEGAPDKVKQALASLPLDSLENVSLSGEAENLAQDYIGSKVITKKHLADAQHIAIATVERVDVLVSWNFQQIVNLNRIHAFNAVNLRLGHPLLEIRSPREVLHEKEI